MKLPFRKSKSPERRSGSRLQSLFPFGGKKSHRLSANVTGEEDWEVDEPQIRMSRAFAVMLILHLVALGGLFAFHMFGKDDREAENEATRLAHQTSKGVPPKAAAQTIPVPQGPSVASSGGNADNLPANVQHLFVQGESRMLVAAKFGITVRQLEEANPDKLFKAGETLAIPQHPRVIGALAEASAPVNPPLALLPASGGSEVAHREFALKKPEDDPYGPVEPLDESGHRIQSVKAEPFEDDEVDETEKAKPAPAPAPAPALPVKTSKKPSPAPEPVVAKTATGSRTHVVQKGDTVYNVARRYSLSPNEVMRANGISDPSRLQMGDVLKITVKR